MGELERRKTLTERLGIAGAMRSLVKSKPGQGDYTLERRDLFAGLTVDQALEEIKKRDGRYPLAARLRRFVR